MGERNVDEKKKQVIHAKERLLKKVEGTENYAMSWWRMCPCDTDLKYPVAGTGGSASETVSEDVRATERDELSVGVESPGMGGTDGGVEMEYEENFSLFRNEAAREVWQSVRAVMFGKKCEDDGDEKKEDETESTILLLARVDAWIMTVLDCLAAEDDGCRGGARQRKYVETYEKFLPLAMEQLTEQLYKFVKEWEPEDLEVEKISVFEDEENMETAEEKAFKKKYGACVAVHVPSIQKAYLAIEHSWFTEYVEADLGIVHDCYIAEFTENFSALKPVAMAKPMAGRDEGIAGEGPSAEDVTNEM